MTEPKSIFDKDRKRWNADDYRMALSQLGDGLLNFQFAIIDRRMLVSPAYLSLSPRASKLLMACFNATWFPERDKDKRNVGKHIDGKPKRIQSEPFMCPYSLAQAFNIGNRRDIKKAFTELKSYGFIRQVGASWYNRPNVYEHIEAYLNLSWTDCERIKSELKSPDTSAI